MIGSFDQLAAYDLFTYIDTTRVNDLGIDTIPVDARLFVFVYSARVAPLACARIVHACQCVRARVQHADNVRLVTHVCRCDRHERWSR